MKKIILLVWLSPIFSNVNFEILNLPHNIYSFSLNKYSFNENLNNDGFLSFSLSKYPSDISLFNFYNNKNFSFSFLDFGILNNQIDDDIFNSFTAYELFFEYKLKRYIKNHIFLIKPSIVHSKIDFHTSTALFCHLSFLYNNNNLFLTANIRNLGLIIDDYLSNSNSIDLNYQIGALKQFPINNLELGLNFTYYDAYKDYQYSMSINKKITDKILLIFNYSSIKKKLSNNHIFTNIFSGISTGIIINNKFYNLGIGIKSLSDAGYSYCISFDFK